MTAIPRAILAPWFAENGLNMPESERLGVGMVFLPQATQERADAKAHIEEIVNKYNIKILGWRTVPVRPETLGRQARENQPFVEQILVTSPI